MAVGAGARPTPSAHFRTHVEISARLPRLPVSGKTSNVGARLGADALNRLFSDCEYQ